MTVVVQQQLEQPLMVQVVRSQPVVGVSGLTMVSSHCSVTVTQYKMGTTRPAEVDLQEDQERTSG